MTAGAACSALWGAGGRWPVTPTCSGDIATCVEPQAPVLALGGVLLARAVPCPCCTHGVDYFPAVPLLQQPLGAV